MSNQPISEADKELIERYLLKRLKKGEAEQVATRMTEEAFAREVKWQQQFLDVVKSQSQQDIKKELQQMENKLQGASATESPARSLRPFWLLAAAVLLILVSLWFFYPRTPTTDDLFAMYYQPYPNELVKVERSTPKISAQQQTFIHYQSEEFEAALEGFDQWLIDSPQSDARFYKAITLMSLDRTTEAIPILESIAAQQGHRFRQAAKWYSALAYLQTDQAAKAKVLLEQLSAAPKGSFNRKAAKELLAKLMEGNQ
ncbi:MAG: hypothetical protein AAF990_24315 [Bacteroidota bacterium]